MPTDPATDAPLVARAVRATTASDRYPDGSAREYARRVLRVNERTVRRWLTGESTIRDRSLRTRVERHAAKLSNRE